jgi:(+)-beta-caryophyllene/(+)-caryolan-1-ol synthase
MFSFVLPHFEMPFPDHGVSPGLADAEQGMWRWLDQYRLIGNESVREHLVRTRPHYTVAVYFPHLDAAQLLPTASYTAWAFIIDDVFDDAISAHDVAAVTKLSTELIGVSLGQQEPSTDAGWACKDILDELSVGRSPQCRAVLGDANARWLRTYPVEARLTAGGRTMRFTDYVSHRRYGVDELIYLNLEEFTQGIGLPPEVRDLPAMVQARERALEWIGLHNDIFSADKEEAVGYLHNAVLIVRDQRGCSTQEAVNAVNEVLTGLIGQFQAACAAVPGQVRAVAGGHPAVLDAAAHVVAGYRQLIRGNYVYHIGTARYDRVPSYMPQAQVDGLRPGWVAALGA